MADHSNDYDWSQLDLTIRDTYITAPEDTGFQQYDPHDYLPQPSTDTMRAHQGSQDINRATSPCSLSRRRREREAAEARFYDSQRNSQMFSTLTQGGDFDMLTRTCTPPSTSFVPMNCLPGGNTDQLPSREVAAVSGLYMHTDESNGIAQLRRAPAVASTPPTFINNQSNNMSNCVQYPPSMNLPGTDAKPSMVHGLPSSQYHPSTQAYMSPYAPIDMSQAVPSFPLGGAPRPESYQWQRQNAFGATQPSNNVGQIYANPDRKRARSDDQTMPGAQGHYIDSGFTGHINPLSSSPPSVYAPTTRVTNARPQRRNPTMSSTVSGTNTRTLSKTDMPNASPVGAFPTFPTFPAPGVSSAAALIPIVSVNPLAVSVQPLAVTANPLTTPPGNSTDPTDPSFTLSFRSAAEAEAHAHRIVQLKVKNDDVDEVKKHPGTWVRKIMKAILQPNDLNSTEETRGSDKKSKSLTNDEAAEFDRWQTVNAQPVSEVLILEGVDDIVTIVEAVAWQLVNKIIQIHTEGVRLSPFDTDFESKCSVRLTKAISLIDRYALVRYDIFNNPICDAFARAPEKFKDRKINNLWVNLGKKGGQQSQTAGKRKTPYSLLTNYFPKKEIRKIKEQNEAEEEEEEELEVDEEENGHEQEEGDDEPAPTPAKVSKAKRAKRAKKQSKGRKSKKGSSGVTEVDDAAALYTAKENGGRLGFLNSTFADIADRDVDDSEPSFLSDLSGNDNTTESMMMAPPPATPTRSIPNDDGGRPSKRARYSL